MRMGDALFLLPICYRTTQFSVNSMAFGFAFTPIGTWIDPLAAFAFTVWTYMESAQCVLHGFSYFFCIHISIHKILHAGYFES